MGCAQTKQPPEAKTLSEPPILQETQLIETIPTVKSVNDVLQTEIKEVEKSPQEQEEEFYTKTCALQNLVATEITKE